MKLFASGFILLIAALVGFALLSSFDDKYWQVALTAQQAITDPTSPVEPTRVLTRSDLRFRRDCMKLACDVVGLVGISIIVGGVVTHYRRTNAAGISK